MYDGRYCFWIQSSSEAKSPFLPPSLNMCKDEVTKSAFYKYYIEHVTDEVTLQMVAEIIQRRKNKISEIVLRGRQQSPFPFDKELDVLETDLKDVEADMAAIGKLKEQLKHGLLSETSAELPYPPVPIKSVPSKATLNMVVEFIQRRKNKIGENVSGERQKPSFPLDKELDVQATDLKDVETYMADIGKRKRIVCETSAELPHSLVPIKRVCRREPSSQGVVIVRAIQPRERTGTGSEDWEKLVLALLKNE